MARDISVRAGWLCSLNVEARRRALMGQIVSWVGLVLHRAEIRSDMKRVFNSANRKRERAAAVSESHAHRWETVEHAAEHHRTDRQRCLGRHANQPRQP